MVTNNRPQFNSQTFQNFCYELKIKNFYSMLRFPQSTGQVEATN